VGARFWACFRCRRRAVRRDCQAGLRSVWSGLPLWRASSSADSVTRMNLSPLATPLVIGTMLCACSSSSGSPSPTPQPDAGTPRDSAVRHDSSSRPPDAHTGGDSGRVDAANDSARQIDAGGADSWVSLDAAAEANNPPSPYTTACSASSMACPGTPLVCEKFSFGGGAITTYACSQLCTSTTDCNAATDPAIQCAAATVGSFCVITCDATSTSPTACPSPLKCVADQGQTVGFCVTL